LLRKQRAISLLPKPDEFIDLGATRSMKSGNVY